MSKTAYPITMSDGTVLEIGNVTWDKIYELEQTGKFQPALDKWFNFVNSGLKKNREMLTALECLYLAYLCSYYGKTDRLMEFPEFLSGLDARKNKTIFLLYNALFVKKK